MVFDKIATDGDNAILENEPGGKYGYRLNRTDGTYTIPDRVLGTVEDRKVKVITIGAGVSGILMAYLIQRDCKNVEHMIYEKNGDVGGTWLEVCQLYIQQSAVTELMVRTTILVRILAYNPLLRHTTAFGVALRPPLVYADSE